MVGGRGARIVRVVLATSFVIMTISGSSSAKIRQPILAGAWYPRDAADLRGDIERYLAAGGKPDPKVRAVIVPHAGYQFSGPTAGRGFATVRGRTFDRVILLGPSHTLGLSGVALPDEDAWRTPLGDQPVDRAAIGTLLERKGFAVLPRAHAQEHCLEIELPFLQVALEPGFRILPMVVGQLDDDLRAEVAAGVRALLDATTLVVVSSDFTHFGPNYGYVPFRDSIPDKIRELDEGAIRAIHRLDPEEFLDYVDDTGATICGMQPIGVLLTLFAESGGKVETLGYARSGDLLDDFSNSVSYAAVVLKPRIAWTAAPPTPAEQEESEKEQAAPPPEPTPRKT
ncbi:MAG: AmmeMemoRadiSam system protein B, partial [Candidatus Eisenbacteria bacterium]|nr:AmmeMemoRadiSam system protein B [Candidatus Latescibacterota bacterium]MBD3301309.1 AmmeMemoRadiSam system protein B [Candidatus Eisenbacteria bacterium]